LTKRLLGGKPLDVREKQFLGGGVGGLVSLEVGTLRHEGGTDGRLCLTSSGERAQRSSYDKRGKFEGS